VVAPAPAKRTTRGSRPLRIPARLIEHPDRKITIFAELDEEVVKTQGRAIAANALGGTWK